VNRVLDEHEARRSMAGGRPHATAQ
jgi:hypothetical protein